MSEGEDSNEILSPLRVRVRAHIKCLFVVLSYQVTEMFINKRFEENYYSMRRLTRNSDTFFLVDVIQ